MNAPTVFIDQVGRHFPPDVDALRDVSAVVRAGERVALMGPSGSGKTTLLNIIGLLDRPSRGHYELDGTDTMTLSDRELTRLRGRVIGFVFQSFHLVPHLTALENVELGLVHAGCDVSARSELARRYLERVGLDHRLAAFPPTLSGGERQRVAIARARVKSPRVLLCDEPTGNLDSATGTAVLDEIFDSQSKDEVLIVVTHNIEVADRADRVLRIQDGVLQL